MIYPYLIMGMFFSIIILLATWLFDFTLFEKVLPRIIIGNGILVFSFVLYKILDFKYPFEETHDLDKRRNHIKKKWWEL